MGQLLGSAVSRNIVLDYDMPEDLPPIEADPAQLSQVVMNLITNASEAIGAAEGRISLRTGMLEVRAADLRRAVFGSELAEGPHVYLEVVDDGCGMDDATRSRIFDPFFTTKFTGRGLGLAAVLGIVRGHEGAIEIESAPGRGTRVRVFFPCALGAPAPPAAAAADLGAWRGEGTVLVVDDDEGARDVICDTLRRAGLRALCAANGREGVECLRRHRNEIRVVVLDRTMPVASGEQTFELMRKTDATVPILLVSGYSEERATDRLCADGLDGFLQKPFQPEQLVEQVRRLIEG
jgi:CheY-like chemotaxis protein